MFSLIFFPNCFSKQSNHMDVIYKNLSHAVVITFIIIYHLQEGKTFPNYWPSSDITLSHSEQLWLNMNTQHVGVHCSKVLISSSPAAATVPGNKPEFDLQ